MIPGLFSVGSVVDNVAGLEDSIINKYLSIDIDILDKSFHDLYLEFATRRDISHKAIAAMWEADTGEPLVQG